ncbi:AbrB/MazE/SpoVT family DNA-binding domain-containing protein [Sphingomonas populi]|uniref:AbrB/MazE/SpoVT family DNA-binding domain-containing protein n=1 Tax=Sphingomonas populi TaxID=2484750 RepID=A0A4Q6XLU2_9SPHN|nr:AbrB/MazE/SpoVT family DNA-binding domain-containing protein [Sphingomonas populi]RZF60851.1 AbrB/MazE/SpoVT family DNA-binding domain-containing protein [Sphingomonas populi]
MNVQRGRLVSGGRLQLPSNIRRSLGLADGDQVVMQVVDGELHVRPARDALKRIQAMLRPYAPVDGSVVEELIADRRAEAARD